ncbi:hypothetical protein T4D_7338 [Trichinella pseudospiralis]|uniref:Uncharacterized protein n=1 Tax=Trichinella pseudospiralis TaxID=6337 RepID=A0A0V1FBN8_TRIPS|nr:hypothetical protein T4D_7338 [Trichinella pseudospiralis]
MQITIAISVPYHQQLNTCLLPYVASDRGRHEADRGRHEAELWNEDIRYMWFPKGPNSKKEEKWRKPREPRKPGSNRLLVSCICWSVAFVGQIQVSEDTLDGEDTIYRSRV